MAEDCGVVAGVMSPGEAEASGRGAEIQRLSESIGLAIGRLYLAGNVSHDTIVSALATLIALYIGQVPDAKNREAVLAGVLRVLPACVERNAAMAAGHSGVPH